MTLFAHFAHPVLSPSHMQPAQNPLHIHSLNIPPLQLQMSTTQSPTFFNSLRKSFADVPIETSKDNAIPTTDFLEATESLCSLFGRPMTGASQFRESN